MPIPRDTQEIQEEIGLGCEGRQDCQAAENMGTKMKVLKTKWKNLENQSVMGSANSL